mmetsp:Transcript_6231/g.10585  ORF Transcript_6231/g.10585 Transcript_6231/m.10585 type:complete len:104 (-) Transcript_6231:452-763(-)
MKEKFFKSKNSVRNLKRHPSNDLFHNNSSVQRDEESERDNQINKIIEADIMQLAQYSHPYNSQDASILNKVDVEGKDSQNVTANNHGNSKIISANPNQVSVKD